MFRFYLVVGAGVVLSCLAGAAVAHTQPIRVFVLAGQSNMVGMGSMQHLDLLVHRNDTSSRSCCCDNPYRCHLWNGTNYKVRDDVFIKFDNRKGPLTVGYGVDTQRFGPELMFGWVLGDSMAAATATSSPSDTDGKRHNKSEPIYLIKTAWGGEDLAVAFRPPRSGEGNYPDIKPSFYGHRFRDMATGVQEGLDDMPNIIPNYNATIGYQISGFVWFQGWNDMLESSKVQEYAYNLANLVRDISAEWQLPQLPVIVGELGMHGVNYTGRGADRVYAMRQAERQVPALPEFRSRALFVPTSPYVVLNGTTYNGQFHYNGRADTYYHIGKAMGEGMLHLLEKQKNHSRLRSAIAAV